MQEAIKQNASVLRTTPIDCTKINVNVNVSPTKRMNLLTPHCQHLHFQSNTLISQTIHLHPQHILFEQYTNDCFGPQNNNWSSRPEQALGGITLSTHSESSHLPTSYGHSLPHQQDGRSLETPMPHPHQVYTHSNSLESAYLKHTAHYYVTPPVRSNFIRQPLHLTYTHTSLWKIHTP